MNSFKVKICGITRVSDALKAVSYGADILGFIFYKKSKRYISYSEANMIIKQLPPTVMLTGVFVNKNVDVIIKQSRKLRLDYIQLSGEETESDINEIKKAGFKVIKTFHLNQSVNESRLLKTAADIIQLDSSDRKMYGGTGKRFDWNVKLPRIENLMLSGGLNKDNVADGIIMFDPVIIDVNSGVETKPGIKSVRKIKEFMDVCNRMRYVR